MSLGHTSNLEMTYASSRKVFTNFHGDITFDDLAVVQVHLHFEVGCADFFNDAVRLVLAVQIKAWYVARVDGFNQYIQALLGRESSSPL